MNCGSVLEWEVYGEPGAPACGVPKALMPDHTLCTNAGLHELAGRAKASGMLVPTVRAAPLPGHPGHNS